MVKDQPLRDVEQRLKLFENGVPVTYQVAIVIWPKMCCCVHRCWHKYSEDQYIGLLIKYLPTLQKNQCLSEILEAFPDVSFVGDVHIVEVHIIHCKLVLGTSQRFTCANWALTHTTPHKFLRAWKWCLSWEFIAEFRTLSRTSSVCSFFKKRVQWYKVGDDVQWTHMSRTLKHNLAFKRVFFCPWSSCCEKNKEYTKHACRHCGRWRGGFIELALRGHLLKRRRKSKIDPPFHTGYFHTGEANTLNFILCSWFPRTVRSTRIQRRGLLCAQVSWNQTCRSRFWHHTSFFGHPFWSSLRHGAGLSDCEK